MRASSKKLRQAVSANLEKVRQALKLSRREMARRLHISPSTFCKNENGTNLPSMSTLSQLCIGYDISMDWFLFDKGTMKPVSKKAQKEQEEPFKKYTDVMPEVLEMLDGMLEDRQLRHEVMLNYYKAKDAKK